MKRHLFSTLIFVILISITNAQQFTFQGKLFNNGTAISGQHDFRFSIQGSNINWIETHNGVYVSNGYYSVVLGSTTPIDVALFKNLNQQQLVVGYNDNSNWVNIDTVTLYSPFERDYTVPDYIKDGIAWNEVTNKPTVDTSFTNELQTLTISNDTLRISQGNAVKLPATVGGGGYNGGDLTVNGSFNVIDTGLYTLLPLLNQGAVTSVIPYPQTIWQSFRSTDNGRLRQIGLWLQTAGTYVVIKIHNGIGPVQAINTYTCYVTPNVGQVWTLNLDLPPLPTNVVYGQNYTIEIVPATNMGLQVRTISTNPYPNGVSSFGSTVDIDFSVVIDHSSPSNITVASNPPYLGQIDVHS